MAFLEPSRTNDAALVQLLGADDTPQESVPLAIAHDVHAVATDPIIGCFLQRSYAPSLHAGQ